MPPTTKDIKFRVLVDDGQASQKFASLDNAVLSTSKSFATLDKSIKSTSQGFGNTNSLLMSTGRIVQDLPYGFMGISNNITFMAEQMGYAKTQGISFKEMLTGMFSALKGPMGIILAISSATTLLTIFGDKLFGIGSATKSAENNVKSLRDEFVSLKQEVNSVISSLNFNEIIAMGQKKSGLKNLILSTQNQLNLETRTDERTRLSLLLAGYKSELEAINKEQEFQNFAFQKWLEMQKESNKTTKDIKENYKEIEKIITGFSAEGKRIDLAGSGLSLPFSDISNKQGGGKNLAGGADVTSGFKKQIDFINDQIRESAQILTGEFKSAWQSAFGEANSLLEKFLMNFAEGLLELATKQAFAGILNWLLPGSGSLASLAMGSQRQPIIFKIGERQWAEAVSAGMKGKEFYRIQS